VSAQEERIVSARRRAEDAEIEAGLRPRRLSAYIGQEQIKQNLAIFIQAAKERGRGPGPCAAVRAAGAGQDDAGGRDRQ